MQPRRQQVDLAAGVATGWGTDLIAASDEYIDLDAGDRHAKTPFSWYPDANKLLIQLEVSADPVVHQVELAAVAEVAVHDMDDRLPEVGELLQQTLLDRGEFPAGDTGLPTPGLGGALVRRGANATSATEVPPNEGNEVRRDGRQEVIAS